MRRRRLLLLSGPALVGVYAWRIEPHWLELVRRPLPVAGLPRDLAGRVLAQVSDVHVGARVDGAYLADSLERLAALRPDFVVLTGDFVQYSAAAGLDELRALLQGLPLGRLGTAAVLGNHDYGRNWAEREVGDAVARTLGAAGATVLRNKAEHKTREAGRRHAARCLNATRRSARAKPSAVCGLPSTVCSL